MINSDMNDLPVKDLAALISADLGGALVIYLICFLAVEVAAAAVGAEDRDPQEARI